MEYILISSIALTLYDYLLLVDDEVGLHVECQLLHNTLNNDFED